MLCLLVLYVIKLLALPNPLIALPLAAELQNGFPFVLISVIFYPFKRLMQGLTGPFTFS